MQWRHNPHTKIWSMLKGGGFSAWGINLWICESRVLISSVWHEGGAVAPSVHPRLLLRVHPWLDLHIFSHFSGFAVPHWFKCICLRENNQCKLAAIRLTCKTCLVHQADIAIKATLTFLSRLLFFSTSVHLHPLVPASRSIHSFTNCWGLWLWTACSLPTKSNLWNAT